MEYRDDELGTHFELPDKPTVRQFLAFDSAVELNRSLSMYERLWIGVVAVAQGWESQHVSLEDGLNTAPSATAIEVIKWAGLVAYSHFQGVREVPKNS